MIYNLNAETMPIEKLRDLQLSRLKKILKYVYSNSTFYKKKFDDFGININDVKKLEDIEKLPFTTKDDLREAFPFGLFSSSISNISEIHVSSGTTGTPTLVSYTKKDLHLWSEVMARCLSCAGVTKNDIIQIAYGYGLFTGGFGAHYGALKLGATVLPMSSGQTKRQIFLMKALKSTVLACTPSYALYLAEEAENEGMNPKSISWKTGIFGAEPWSENMRKEVERRLGIKAHDIYGMSEIIGPGVAIECEKRNGLHIWADVFYPEIIDPKTQQAVTNPSQKGELVITTLTKQGMPLIRYKTRDLVSISYEKCTCGRTLPRISKISGRIDDMLVVRGINLFPSQIEHVLLNIKKGITPNYQIIVDRGANYQDSLEIIIELDDKTFSDSVAEIEKLKEQIIREMVPVITITPKLRLVPPKTIKRSEGKAIRVIDKRRI